MTSDSMGVFMPVIRPARMLVLIPAAALLILLAPAMHAGTGPSSSPRAAAVQVAALPSADEAASPSPDDLTWGG